MEAGAGKTSRTWTEEESANARRQIILCGAFHSVGLSCGGVAVLILCASYLGVPESVSACFGGLDYFGYFALPLGYYLCGRFGVCKGTFLTRTSGALAYFLILFSLVRPATGVWLMPVAALFVASMVAASFSMTFPFQKFITNEKNISGYLGRLAFCGYVPGLAASLIVAWAIKHFQTNAMTLGTLFFLAGFFFVLGVSRYLRIKEPEALGAIVRQPLYRRIPELFHFPDYRKLCLLGVFANMMLVMMPPACILAARNGWGAGDSLVVVLTTVQALSCICTSLAYKRLGAVFGPRRLLLFCGPLVLSVILFWGLMPLDMPKVFLLIPFILCGMIVVFIGSSLSHYITVTVPVDLQPPGSLGVMIFHGAIAGLLGMVLNYVLFKVLWLLPETTPMTHYRQFFLCCLVLCAFFLFVVSGMPSPRENGGKQFEKCGSRG